jgi:hypothetical protein
MTSFAFETSLAGDFAGDLVDSMLRSNRGQLLRS